MYDLSLRHIGPTPVLLAELSCLSSFNNTCLNSGSMLVLIPIFLYICIAYCGWFTESTIILANEVSLYGIL